MSVSGEARGSQEELVLHPGTRWLIAKWVELKGDGPLPARAAFDLAQLPRLAPWLFIAEPSQNGFSYRLAGTGLCGFLGREVTGTDLLAGWERFERGVMEKALKAVVRRNRLAMFRVRFLTDRDEMIGADMPALPMIARDGSVHVLGALFPHGDPKLWQYHRLAPAELAAARLIDWRRNAPVVSEERPTRRRFKVIPGGLESI